jgi:hypothetical protein
MAEKRPTPFELDHLLSVSILGGFDVWFEHITQAWTSLVERYAFQLRSHISQLKRQLQSL